MKKFHALHKLSRSGFSRIYDEMDKHGLKNLILNLDEGHHKTGTSLKILSRDAVRGTEWDGYALVEAEDYETVSSLYHGYWMDNILEDYCILEVIDLNDHHKLDRKYRKHRHL